VGVCETVKALAEAIAQAKAPQEARHRLMVEILRLMPLYRDIHDLTAWESAFQGALHGQDDDSEVGHLLWELFEFGRYNMYGAFDAPGTAKEFASLAKLLTRGDVPVPQSPGLTGW
jgi:hypothetical protein